MSDKGGNGPVYRPHVGGGMDEGTKRLALIASGIGLFLLVVVGGWSLGGHRGAAGEIPVIGPDPGPIKIKPANPGGLQLTGAEPPPANDDNGSGPSLAPGPEKPNPAALQAELDAARHADTPPAAPPAAPAAATTVPATPAAPATRVATVTAATPGISKPGVSKPGEATTVASTIAAPPPSPVPAAPVPHVAAATPAAAQPAASPSSLQAAIASLRAAPPTSGIAVQLAAVDTAAEAHAQWDRLAHAHPGLLGSRAPLVLTAERDGNTFYRLRTGGFATVAAATAFCTQLRAAGAACTIAAF